MSTPAAHQITAAREAIGRWFRLGLQAVDPYQATRQALRLVEDGVEVDGLLVRLPQDRRLIGISVGKAAAPMARTLEEVVGDRLSQRILLTKDGHLDGAPTTWTQHEASHPIPDQRGVSATEEILAALSDLSEGDVVFVLVSGGGSALLEAPRPPLTLDDIRTVTDLLLRAGAPIHHLNAVRSELSQVKGGGLRRSMGKATVVSLILSDVLGNDPTVIASGPTVQRTPDPARALNLIAHYGIGDQVPPPVMTMLQTAASKVRDQSAEGTREADDVFAIVGDNARLIDTVVAAAKAEGFTTVEQMTGSEGEAADLARKFVAAAMSASEEVDVIVGGGEATVTVSGNGSGGRNTEFALVAATELQPNDGWVIASLASDGQDGSVDAAGAIVDPETINRGRERGLIAADVLADNDSGGYFAALDELFVTGPTGTNVNDLYIAVRSSRFAVEDHD